MKEKANKFLYGDGYGFSYVLESAFAIIGKMFTLASIIVIVLTMNIGIVIIFLTIVLMSAVVDMYINAVSVFSYSVKDVISSFIDIRVYSVYYEAFEKYINIPETLRGNKKLPASRSRGFYNLVFKCFF